LKMKFLIILQLLMLGVVVGQPYKPTVEYHFGDIIIRSTIGFDAVRDSLGVTIIILNSNLLPVWIPKSFGKNRILPPSETWSIGDRFIIRDEDSLLIYSNYLQLDPGDSLVTNIELHLPPHIRYAWKLAIIELQLSYFAQKKRNDCKHLGSDTSGIHYSQLIAQHKKTRNITLFEYRRLYYPDEEW
jgi:hypothetical protein